MEEDVPSAEVQEMKRSAVEQKPRGFIIDHDPLPSKHGFVNPAKLKIEFIRDMNYICLWYSGTTFNKLDLDAEVTDDQTDRADFDFSSSRLISRLAQRRNEGYLKLGYELKKPGAVAFLPVEHDFIFDQMHVHADEVQLKKLKAATAVSYPGIALGQLGQTRRRALSVAIRPYFDDPKNWPLDMSQATKERRREQFDEMFEGNTHISRVINGQMYDNEMISAEPRPGRSLIMLNAQRSCVRRGCRDFMLMYNPAHTTEPTTAEHGSDSEPAVEEQDEPMTNAE